VSTAKALHSIRKLLAFGCVILSLILVGVGELASEVAYGGFGPFLTLAGVALALVSSIWLVIALSATAERDVDGGDAADGDASDEASTGST
jgi:uncharacterized protein (DUF58 family)